MRGRWSQRVARVPCRRAARPRGRIAAVVMGLGVGVYGCVAQEDARRDVPAVTVDSAGIRIVTSTAPAWDEGEGWRVGPTPTVSLGGLGSAIGHLIWEVGGAARLSDGRLAVLVGGRESPRIAIFDRRGELMRSIGRAGEGPGEFVEPLHFQHRPGDTLVVWERHFGRITSFDTTGNVVELRRIDLARARPALNFGGGREVHLPLVDGSFVVRSNAAPPPRRERPVEEWVREPRVYVRLHRDYSADTLGWYGGPTWGYLSSTAVLPVIPLNSPRSAVAATGYGGPIEIYVGHGDERGIRGFDEDGRLVRILRRPGVALPILESDRRASMRRLMAFNDMDREGAAGYEHALSRFPEPTHHPPANQLLVDRLGYLWALDKTHDTWGGLWSVFAPDGRWLGRIPVPLFRIYDIGEDYILGLSMDETLVEGVLEYPLIRR